MDFHSVEAIADAVLYEGYLLYPYRASTVKNRQRWNFGVLNPPDCPEPCMMQTECLVSGGPGIKLHLKVRFLHLVSRETRKAGDPLPQGSDRDFAAYGPAGTWQEAREREIAIVLDDIPALEDRPMIQKFAFESITESEESRDREGSIPGVILRKQEVIHGSVEVYAAPLHERLFKLGVRIRNTTQPVAKPEDREKLLLESLVSAHAILGVAGGEFVSLLDPPDPAREEAAQCQNIGTWPVLAGPEDHRDCMLSSPIILYDYPQIAPESAGPLFDGTEIDEILTLRILTLTDDEKQQMREVDDRARQILDRTEAMPPEQFMKLHGAVRRPVTQEVLTDD